MLGSGLGRKLLYVAACIGWALLGLLAWKLVERVGWLGVALLGVIVLFVVQRAEMNEESSDIIVPGAHRGGDGPRAERRLADQAQKTEFERWLAATRAIGFALAALGAFMFMRHQL
ncbi:MAG: hypothetical protein HY246_02920 [Proteobacteria bacterium]|nr:hypothetical protein [Pseudomonadota bacterium]